MAFMIIYLILFALLFLIYYSYKKLIRNRKEYMGLVENKEYPTRDINYKGRYVTSIVSLVSLVVITLLYLLGGARELSIYIPSGVLIDCGPSQANLYEALYGYTTTDVMVIEIESHDNTDKFNVFKPTDFYSYTDIVYHNYNSIKIYEGYEPTNPIIRQWVDTELLFYDGGFMNCSPSESVEVGKVYLVVGSEREFDDIYFRANAIIELPNYNTSLPIEEQNQEVLDILDQLNWTEEELQEYYQNIW